MKHEPLTQLRTVADIATTPPVLSRAMTRRERLERWATCLEREPGRRLKSLDELELVPRAERANLRADNSPLTVAFEDRVLRDEGLASDRYGDAKSFFQLSEGDAHRVLCSCLNGRSMAASRAARLVRGLATRERERISAAVIAGAVGLPALMYLFG